MKTECTMSVSEVQRPNGVGGIENEKSNESGIGGLFVLKRRSTTFHTDVTRRVGNQPKVSGMGCCTR